MPTKTLKKVHLQLPSKPLSYNNILDADTALDCVKSFGLEEPVCVIVKHANPCGIAMSDSQLKAYLRAFQSDPKSAYDGIIAFNQTLQTDTAVAILQHQFVEVIIAPDISDEAKVILASKEHIRVLATGLWHIDNEYRLNMRKIEAVF